MKATSRQKRVFRVAESLAEFIQKQQAPIQPEDLLTWVGCHLPITDEEASEDVEEMAASRPAEGRGSLALARLRASLGFVAGDSLISVIEKAAEVCEASVDQIPISERWRNGQFF